MACILVSGTAFSVLAVDFRNSLQEVTVASYDSSKLSEYADQIAVLVNKERNSYGLQPVKVSPILSEAANIRASELKENFSHTRPNSTSCFTAMSELEIQYSTAAENIAYGQKNPKSVMNALWKSLFKISYFYGIDCVIFNIANHIKNLSFILKIIQK